MKMKVERERESIDDEEESLPRVFEIKTPSSREGEENFENYILPLLCAIMYNT